MADPLPVIPSKAISAVECVHRVLKSSSAVQSVDLYSIDGTGFAVEYVFRNKDNHAAAYDIELFIETDGSVTETDKIPREVSQETMNEAQDLESKLDLLSKCRLSAVLDNLLPGPKRRADWRHMNWPGGR